MIKSCHGSFTFCVVYFITKHIWLKAVVSGLLVYIMVLLTGLLQQTQKNAAMLMLAE